MSAPLPPAVDVALTFAGSICLVHLLTEEARDWVDEHVSADRQTWCGALVVETRYVDTLAAGMQSDGLTVCLEDR
jgi:hypothetical protein